LTNGVKPQAFKDSNGSCAVSRSAGRARAIFSGNLHVKPAEVHLRTHGGAVHDCGVPFCQATRAARLITSFPIGTTFVVYQASDGRRSNDSQTNNFSFPIHWPYMSRAMAKVTWCRIIEPAVTLRPRRTRVIDRVLRRMGNAATNPAWRSFKRVALIAAARWLSRGRTTQQSPTRLPVRAGRRKRGSSM